MVHMITPDFVKWFNGQFAAAIPYVRSGPAAASGGAPGEVNFKDLSSDQMLAFMLSNATM